MSAPIIGIGRTAPLSQTDATTTPIKAPAPIATLEENLSRIALHGLDAALVIPFTREFSLIEAEAFVDLVLVRTLGVREVVVGFNHTFGAGARGTAALLLELGGRRGFVTHVLPPLQVDGLTVSSSTIREALREGGVELAGARVSGWLRVYGPDDVLLGVGQGLGDRVKPERLLHADPHGSSVLPA